MDVVSSRNHWVRPLVSTDGHGLAAASASNAADCPAPASDATQPATGLPPLVLLVEDNYINQVVALEFLSLLGVRSRLAKNGEEALAVCAEAPPSLVLMDIQMPVMDGLECARRLRELQRAGSLPGFPILALTAHALDADVAASLEAGMDEHLTKPLDFGTLRARLQSWLGLPDLN